MADRQQKICGIESKTIEQFLELLRDKYPLADEATYFLETNQGVSSITSSITNQRDALSHLVTLLSHPEWTEEQQREQLTNAEEHIRRACIEPYEIAVSLEVEKISTVLKRYREVVVPHREKLFPTAPDYGSIQRRVRAISEARIKARSAKTENRWSSRWEEALKLHISTFQDARALLHELEGWVDRGDTKKDSRQSHQLHVWHFVLAIVLFVGGLLIGHFMHTTPP